MGENIIHITTEDAHTGGKKRRSNDQEKWSIVQSVCVHIQFVSRKVLLVDSGCSTVGASICIFISSDRLVLAVSSLFVVVGLLFSSYKPELNYSKAMVYFWCANVS